LQVHFYVTSSNTWDNGYPSGGNYWSDSNKTDLYGSAGQNITGSDGICDRAFIINVSPSGSPEETQNNIDRYPLVSPYPSHDLAVTELRASKTIVGKGSALFLSVTIVNKGDFRENVSFSLSLNSTVISNSTFSYPFEIRQSTTILLIPITASLAYGNYTAKVHVTPVAGETNFTNNDKSCWFFITIPGDANADKKVNVLDLILIATHLGIPVYSSQWNSNFDLNSDAAINVLDLILCATHKGQHW
jgi:hypothetical protein